MAPPFTHIAPDVVLGHNVRLAGFCNLYGCEVGDECTLGTFVEIQCGARLGRKVKVQSHIQGDQVRVSGKAKDDLQAVMRAVKEHDFYVPLQFTNFRP